MGVVLHWDLPKLLSSQWVTKHPLAWWQIATDPTPTAHYQPTRSTNKQWQQSYRGFRRHPCSLLWPLHHIFHPKNNVFWDSATEESVPPPKTIIKNRTTGATTPAQLPTTPLSPHSGKPWRLAALTYLNAPYFVVGGGTLVKIHNAQEPRFRNVGQTS
jgi:hypothetical protein